MVSADIIEKLPKILKPISDEQGANAAVALLLKSKHSDFDVLFVKRVKKTVRSLVRADGASRRKTRVKRRKPKSYGLAGNIGGDRPRA